LVADVPISTFLSGGLDSSLITKLATRHAGDIDSYTISFREQDRRFEAMPDDLGYARSVARSLGIRLHEVEIAPNIAELLPKLVWHMDEPIGDAAAINAFLICMAARESGRKVLLSGMGADELFAGYRRHYACVLASKYRRLPRIVRKGFIEPMVRRLPAAGRRRGYRAARWARRFVDFAGLREEDAFLRSYAHYDRSQLRTLLGDEVEPQIDQVIDHHHAVYSSYRGPDVINRMCLTDVQLFLPGLNLAYTDRASMAASTEVRVPFVDKEVFAAAFAIPGKEKIAGTERKAALKLAAKPWLPPEIIYRPKGLFSAPLRAWIRNDLESMVEELVIRGTNVQSGLFNRNAVERMVADDRSGRADFSKEIWHLLTLELWCRQAEQGTVDSATFSGAAK
jgi:asparagine synthase (glutamine-hydrolysing)